MPVWTRQRALAELATEESRWGARDGGDPVAFLYEALEGRWSFVARAWREDARVFELTARCPAMPLSPRERDVFALVARGASNEEAAHVLGVLGSTLCGHVGAITRRMRARPIDLVAFGPLLEHVERGGPCRLLRRGHAAILTYPTPIAITRALTPSELLVARVVADGASNVEIALARGTSVRTVANQIAALYRKLGARCRRECALALYGAERVPIERTTLDVLERVVDGARPCVWRPQRRDSLRRGAHVGAER